MTEEWWKAIPGWKPDFGGNPPPLRRDGLKYLGSFPMGFHFNDWCLLLVVDRVKQRGVQN
jgi:hypothetical protein